MRKELRKREIFVALIISFLIFEFESRFLHDQPKLVRLITHLLEPVITPLLYIFVLTREVGHFVMNVFWNIKRLIFGWNHGIIFIGSIVVALVCLVKLSLLLTILFWILVVLPIAVMSFGLLVAAGSKLIELIGPIWESIVLGTIARHKLDGPRVRSSINDAYFA